MKKYSEALLFDSYFCVRLSVRTIFQQPVHQSVLTKGVQGGVDLITYCLLIIFGVRDNGWHGKPKATMFWRKEYNIRALKKLILM